MRRSIGPGVTVMLLLVMLAAMAVGYALWSKTLTIRSVVQTGSVHARFVDAFTDDDDGVDRLEKDSQDTGDCPDIGGVDDQGPLFKQKDPSNTDGLTSCDPAATGRDPKPHYDKDVARCDARIDPDDDNVAQVFKRNVYPSYHCTAWFDILIDGTIPVKVAAVLLNGVPVVPSVPTPFDLNGDGRPDVEIHISEIRLCSQLHPGDIVQMDIDQHILQEAPQGATLSYTVQVQLNQWNEPGPLCGTDTIVDADGTVSAGDGLGNCGIPATPGALNVFVGAPLTSWPTGGGGVGIDWFDKGSPGDGAWTLTCSGDDLHSEDTANCPTALRDGKHDLGLDCKILDHNGDLANLEGVECDLEFGIINPNGFSADGVACPPTNGLVFYDANGSGFYDDGEDIVLDNNGNGVFD